MAVEVGSAIGYLDLDISKFLSGLETALNRTEASKNKIEALGSKISGVGDKLESAGKSLNKKVTVPIMGLGTAAVTTTANFESAMSKVSAISGATGTDLEDLSDKAKEMGANTKFSASEAAEAFQYMAMAGWKTEDMLSGIEGVLNLAAASGEDLATTSDIVTDALTAFGLTAADTARFSNVLAAASSNANTNVSMMGETFKYAAPIAGALGYSIEDTAEAIGLMANSGIKGSQAGTTLRNIMTKLSGEIEICGEQLGEFTVQTTNSDGSMRDFNDILADCRTAFAQLSESEQASAASSLVGQEAMSGFLALMNAAPQDIEKLRGAINSANDGMGAAAEMAETMQDNLTGQLTILKSTLEGLAISFGELMLPVIKDVVSGLQNLLTWINNLDEGQKKTIITLAIVAAAVGPVLLVLGKLVSGVGSVITVIGKASTLFSGFASAASTVAAPAEAAGKGVGGLAKTALNLLAAGAGILMAAGGLALLAQSAIALAEAGWPAIAVMGGLVGTLALLAVGASAIGPALTAGAVGLVAFGGAIALIGVGVLAATSGVALLATQLPTISEHGGAAAGGLLEMGGAIAALAISCATLDIAVVALLIPLAGLTIELGLSAVACGLLSAAMESTATSVTTIESSAASAAQSLSDMVSSVDVVKAGLDGLGASADSAAQWVANAFVQNGPTASAAARTMATNITDSVRSGLEPIPQDTNSTMLSMNMAITTGMTQANNTIRSGFSSAVAYIKGLAGQSYSWGADMMQGLISGIYSRMGSLRSAVNAAANIIYSNLHFSRPDDGPLRNYETWMPDFMTGLAKGINSNLYQIEGAVGNVADRLVVKPEYSTEGMFTAAASNDLQEYNIILVNTIELYRQLAEQMRLCSVYSTSFRSTDNGLLEVGLKRAETPTVPTPTVPEPESSNKPDQLVIPITIGEEHIETVVVDLLRREVRM
jgi:TP901 family phage tail tape measure protein